MEGTKLCQNDQCEFLSKPHHTGNVLNDLLSVFCNMLIISTLLLLWAISQDCKRKTGVVTYVG